MSILKRRFRGQREDNDILKEVDEESRLGNEKLLKYYQTIIPKLKKIPYKATEARPDISNIIADGMSKSKEAWRTMANRLSIDSKVFELIEQSAEFQKLRPLDIILKRLYPVQDSYTRPHDVGLVVEVLLQMPRLDILKSLEGPIKEFLQDYENKSINIPQRQVQINSSYPVDACYFKASRKATSSDPPLSVDSGINSMSMPHEPVATGKASDSAALPADNAQLSIPYVDDSSYQPHFGDESNHNDLHSDDRGTFPGKRITSFEDMLSSEKKSSVSKKKQLSVFVTHVDKDFGVARELAQYLRSNYDFVVFLQGEMETSIISYDSFLKSIIEQVDAIVPLVSKSYKESYDRFSNGELESFSETSTCEIYSLFYRRLVSNACRCNMLFPVRMDLTYSEIKHDLIFCRALKLWEEVHILPRLIIDCQKPVLPVF